MAMKLTCSGLLVLALAPAAMAQVALDAPAGGWRQSAGAREDYTQEIHYPANSVSMQQGQAASAQIRGRIHGAAKQKPATLVVNGVPMPLEVQPDGSFGRPYGFGSGSNNVEVRSPDGKGRARAQFFDGYQGKTQARLRVVLSWDSPGTDLDLHVLAPDGGHAWYGNRVMKNGGAIDVDVTTGYGPEIFSSAAPPRGLYHVYVNYYGSGGDGRALTIAQVAVITNENTPREKRQVFQVPMRAPGELTLVKSFMYP
jgi:uncharacterized protein YfaP (DUF2135 family)